MGWQKKSMRKISPQVKEELLQEKNICARHNDGNCAGRITFEHALIYGGKQIDETWAILHLCEFHHAVGIYQDGGDLNKEKNVWIALNRATEQELIKYSKAVNYLQLRERLNKIYGTYNTNQSSLK